MWYLHKFKASGMHNTGLKPQQLEYHETSDL